jgi:hypothetical protein
VSLPILEHRVIKISEQRHFRIARTEFNEKRKSIESALELFCVVPIVWQYKSTGIRDTLHSKDVPKEASSCASRGYTDESLLATSEEHC